jgi:hypothetical protein
MEWGCPSRYLGQLSFQIMTAGYVAEGGGDNTEIIVEGERDRVKENNTKEDGLVVIVRGRFSFRQGQGQLWLWRLVVFLSDSRKTSE